MGNLTGLNRWEQYWCRRAAFSRWSQTEWFQDALFLLFVGVIVWSIHSMGLDSETAIFGGMAGMMLGGVISRNLPIRTHRVIGRLTRALEDRDQA
jgi:membrane associated rhomboid family serine protease